MRRWLAALALLAGAAAIGLYLSHSKKTQTGAPVQPNALTNRVAAASNPPAVHHPNISPATPPATTPAAVSKTSAPQSTVSPEPPPPSPPPELGALDFRVSGPPQIAPEIALENTRTAIRDYGSMFGGNPVGTNPEITAALNGKNPKQARLLQPDAGMRINGNGELVDPWGTPYFFHQLSGSQMEIHSAGPDKKMWTEDDLVIK
jgi:hypothetical protein